MNTATFFENCDRFLIKYVGPDCVTENSTLVSKFALAETIDRLCQRSCHIFAVSRVWVNQEEGDVLEET